MFLVYQVTLEMYKKPPNGNERAQLALDIFFRRVIAYIGRYFIALGGVDAICFTAGIGENSFFARKEICNLLAEALGIEMMTMQTLMVKVIV